MTLTTTSTPVNFRAMPDESGRFGPYGGKYVPETLMPALDELEEAYLLARNDKELWRSWPICSRRMWAALLRSPMLAG